MRRKGERFRDSVMPFWESLGSLGEGSWASREMGSVEFLDAIWDVKRLKGETETRNGCNGEGFEGIIHGKRGKGMARSIVFELVCAPSPSLCFNYLVFPPSPSLSFNYLVFARSPSLCFNYLYIYIYIHDCMMEWFE